VAPPSIWEESGVVVVVVGVDGTGEEVNDEEEVRYDDANKGLGDGIEMGVVLQIEDEYTGDLNPPHT